MSNNKYLGFYNGIIVQNNDPDHAGKVKVWVPHISPTVYSGWISLVQENKRFKFLGSNVAEQFTLIVEELKIILPWADIAMPLTNEGASGRYFANKQYGTISDSNVYDSVVANDNYVENQSLNYDNIGEKPAYLYEQQSTSVSDAFTTTNNNVTHINPFANIYKPSSYSNSAKGEFGIPSVGAHVWVFFREGDVNFPVICFSSFGQVDWQGIYNTDNDYPGGSENIQSVIGEYNHNVDKYRSKYVLNQKGGTLEIINTDHNEKIKLTHYSGSFKEMNNVVTSELAVGNDQKLVLEDQFITVKGNKSHYTGGDSDEIVNGDRYVKVGNLNYNAFRDWKSEMVDVNNMRQLFDIKRTDDQIEIKRGDNVLLRFNSTNQTKDKKGKHTNNDVLSYSVSAFICKSGDKVISMSRGGVTTAKWSENGMTDTAYGLNDDSPTAGDAANQSGYNKVDNIELHKPSEEIKDSNVTDYPIPESSPSSMNGEFASEEKIIENILTNDRLERLFAAEEKMGIGGSEIIQITKDKVETIGLLINDFGSIRIDSKGKYYASEMRISNATSFVNKSASPLIEYVHVDDFPGGSYTLNVNNKYNLLVGAGGVNLKTYGSFNIGGAITNVSGEQVNIGSRNEINLVCDKRLNISADILTLRQKHQKQVLVDSSLGVSRNLIIGGKSYFEQEMYLHHITAPREIQVTYPSTVYAKPELGVGLGTFECHLNGFNQGDHSIDADGTITIKICKESIPNSIVCTQHGHNFDNIPLTLMDTNSEVRAAARNANIDNNLK